MGHRLVSISAAAVLAGACLLAVVQVGTVVAASEALTITSGGCSGGGTSYCYNPEQLSAKSGDTATWTDQSGINHTVTSCTAAACPGAAASTGPQTFDVPVNAGGSGSVTFTQGGTYVYYCKIHGYAALHGTVTVAAATTPTPAPTAASSPTASPATGAGAGTAAPAAPNTGAGIVPAAGLAAALVALGSATWVLAARRRDP